MKTIKDIITRKKTYSDIVNPETGAVVLRGGVQGRNEVSTRNTLATEWIGGEFEVNIEKFQIVVAGYSKILPYRHQQNGYKPTLETKYRYTYTEGRKRLTSRDFVSLKKLMDDLNDKTPKVVLGATTMEVLETE